MYSLFSVVDFGPSRSGLGNVGYTAYDSAAVPAARVTAGVNELTAGQYGVMINFSSDFAGAIVWDSGEVDPVYAVEVINPPSATGGASDPWETILPNSYSAHSAGAILAKLDIGAVDEGVEAISLTSTECTFNGSTILFPLRVKSVIAASLNGEPIDIRNMLFQYQQNGPGRFGCADMLIDEGERYFAETGKRRRQYRLTRGGTDTKAMTFVAKLKWVKKEPGDEMTIRNFEAMRLMASAVVMEKQEKLAEAAEFEKKALAELDFELREYLAGQQLTIPMRRDQWNMQTVGGLL